MATEATWPVFMTALTARKEVADRTMAFQFEKPSDWAFKAGQFIDITLIDPPETDAEGNTRGFSIASAPHEDFLMVATRMRDNAFKRTLKATPLGTKVKIEGPFGNLILHNKTSRPAVILAGGIGITPFRSILVNAAKEKLPHHIFLFDANRRPEDAPFLAELQELQKENPNFRLIATMTQMEKSKRPWQGETGYIRQEMLSKYLKGVENAIYYIAGPAAMVGGLHRVLNSAGVDDDDIRIEEFAGY
ncbi:MAG: FAD-dependent oxidoreductase [Acidobacteriaceae bacterium]